MRNIFTEIQDKAVILITGKIRPEANAFDVGWSRKYSRGGYFLIGGLSGYITHSTVDMGQFIGGDKYPLLTLLSGPISRLRNHTVKHKSSTLRLALELRLHGLCIICKTHVTHKISTARLSSRKVLCV